MAGHGHAQAVELLSAAEQARYDQAAAMLATRKLEVVVSPSPRMRVALCGASVSDSFVSCESHSGP